MNKVRKIDFNADEFLVGVTGLAPEEVGVYWTICSLMISSGGRIPEDDERLFRILRAQKSRIKRIVDGLVEKGKFLKLDSNLHQKRVENELKVAQVRIETARKNGTNGGRPSIENNGLAKPDGLTLGSGSEKLPLPPPPKEESKNPPIAPPGGQPSLFVVGDDGSRKRQQKVKKFPIPEDWVPTDICRAYAKKLGLTDQEIVEETVKFIRYWTGPDAIGGGLKADWGRTWQNRIDDVAAKIIERRPQSEPRGYKCPI